MYPGRGWVESAPPYAALAWLVGRRAVVANASMYPLLRPGDRVLFDRLAYWLRAPRRGEVVLVRGPAGRPPLLVKVVAGLPGERVAVAEDRFWVEGQPLKLWAPVVGGAGGAWALGAGEYFLLSYALATGTDSRQLGPVARAALIGPARRVYWPPERRGPVARLTAAEL